MIKNVITNIRFLKMQMERIFFSPNDMCIIDELNELFDAEMDC